MVLVLSGTFDQLLTYTGFAVILFSALAVFSLFFVRRTPADDVVFRAWGYPWAPGVFCLVSLAIVINTIAEAPGVASRGPRRHGRRDPDLLVDAHGRRPLRPAARLNVTPLQLATHRKSS